MLGATGTIGRATLRELAARGHDVVCFGRRRPISAPSLSSPGAGLAGAVAFAGADGSAGRIELRRGDVLDPASVAREGFRGERFDAVMSCMASRTGVPRDAWAVDHDAHRAVLDGAGESGVGHFVLLSAICVQKPRLAFQHAKRAFEHALAGSSLTWSIVRPTAFFKSLSGQIERVRAGRPFLVFGDGALTACKPIAAEDLAEYLADCLEDRDRHDRILPIGGPGPALTPRDQGELIFAAAGRPPRFRSVPPALLSVAAGVLGSVGRLVQPLADRAEMARIGHYYATESMLVWDPVADRYDADATPEYGSRTLVEHYRRRLAGEVEDDRGEHAVF